MADYSLIEQKMQKTLDVLKEDLDAIRVGRANAAILDKVFVEYYGVQTPISQLATVSIPEARSIVIQPWSAGMLDEINKAIQKSDIGINPNNDGKVIRLVFPALTEEKRKETSKKITQMGESSKIALRAIRRDAMDQFEKMKKNVELTEDDLKRAKDDIQRITDLYVSKVQELIHKKEEEIMTV